MIVCNIIWDEEIFQYHLAGITLVGILINYVIAPCEISMIDFSNMELVVKAGVQRSMDLVLAKLQH